MDQEKETIYNHLPLWNQNGEIFKGFIGDKFSPEKPDIKEINDINGGAVYNAVEWHVRFQELARVSASLGDALSVFLDIWGKVLNIFRPNSAYSDTEYRGFIIGKILSTVTTTPGMRKIFKDFPFYHCEDIGFFADFSCSDVGVLDPNKPNRLASSITTYHYDAVYVYTDDLALITPELLARAKTQKAAGTAILIGEY